MVFQESKVRRFKQVDVFSSIPCLGNPVAVVLDAHGLSNEVMQRLARWTNLSETTFILADKEADYHLKIFSLDREIPFAGHPTIGSALAAIEAGIVDGSKPFRMRCGLGLLSLRAEGNKIWVKVPPPRMVDIRIDNEMLCAALNGLELLDPLVFDAGPIWMVSRVESLDDLNKVRFDRKKLVDLSRKTVDAAGLILYAFNEEKGIEVRAFAPAVGVDEDPVCGSGNIAAAGHLKETGKLTCIGTKFQARQGRYLGRNGILFLVVNDAYLELGGEAVTVFDGEVRL